MVPTYTKRQVTNSIQNKPVADSPGAPPHPQPHTRRKSAIDLFSRSIPFRLGLCALVALAGLVGAQSRALAQNGTWNQTGAGPFDWGTAGNWSGNTIANGADNTAFFTPNITANQTVNLAAPQTIGNISSEIAGNDGLLKAGGGQLTGRNRQLCSGYVLDVHGQQSGVSAVQFCRRCPRTRLVVALDSACGIDWMEC